VGIDFYRESTSVVRTRIGFGGRWASSRQAASLPFRSKDAGFPGIDRLKWKVLGVERRLVSWNLGWRATQTAEVVHFFSLDWWSREEVSEVYSQMRTYKPFEYMHGPGCVAIGASSRAQELSTNHHLPSSIVKTTESEGEISAVVKWRRDISVPNRRKELNLFRGLAKQTHVAGEGGPGSVEVNSREWFRG